MEILIAVLLWLAPYILKGIVYLLAIVAVLYAIWCFEQGLRNIIKDSILAALNERDNATQPQPPPIRDSERWMFS